MAVSRNALCARETFSLNGDSDWTTRAIGYQDDRLSFDILYRKKLFRNVRLAMYGSFNIRNALAATAVLHRVGVPEDDIRNGLEQFRGVRLREFRRLRARVLRLDAVQILERLRFVAEPVIHDAEFVHCVADFGVRRVLIDDLSERLARLFERVVATDVLPVGDYGVRKGMQRHFRLRDLPDAAKMTKLAAPWRPFRTASISAGSEWSMK